MESVTESVMKMESASESGWEMEMEMESQRKETTNHGPGTTKS